MKARMNIFTKCMNSIVQVIDIYDESKGGYISALTFLGGRIDE